MRHERVYIINIYPVFYARFKMLLCLYVLNSFLPLFLISVYANCPCLKKYLLSADYFDKCTSQPLDKLSIYYINLLTIVFLF